MQPSIFERSAILVHAAGDSSAAGELAAFLEKGMQISIAPQEGCVASTLVEAFQRALSAGNVIVLLSSEAVVRRGSGPAWEQAFVEASELGVRVACLFLETCVPPAVLRRAPSFDATGGRLAAFRAVKRWMLAPSRPVAPDTPAPLEPADPAEIEALRRAVADQPGEAHLPAGSPLLRHLLEHCREEFEAVIWIDCALRREENLVAELGVQLGLVLAGPLEADVAAIARHLQQPRILLALENFGWPGLLPSLASPHGSLVTTAPDAAIEPDAAAVLHGLRQWNSDAPRASAALAHAAAAFESVLASDWETARSIGCLASLVTRRCSRYVEAYRWLERLESEAVNRLDRALAVDSARERAWIAESWGLTAHLPPSAAAQPRQLSLFQR